MKSEIWTLLDERIVVYAAMPSNSPRLVSAP
jgi:hypothetical protein